MADIRINALATTAASTASDDFIAVDGSANGTRKLNAYSPTFGGNLTVSGTGTSTFSGNLNLNGTDKSILLNGASTQFSREIDVRIAGDTEGRLLIRGGGSLLWGDGAGGYDSTLARTAANMLTITGGLTTSGNLTVSGAGTSSVAGSFGVGAASPVVGFSGNEAAWIVGANRTDGGGGLYPILVTLNDTRAYNATNPSPGGGLGFTYKYNTAGNYASGVTIQGFKENSTDGDYAGGLRFLTRANAAQPAEAMRITSSGNLLLKSDGTDSSNGKLQLATHTTSAGGIGFGTDVSLYRFNTGQVVLDGTTGNSAVMWFAESGTRKGYLQSNAGNLNIYSTGGSIVLASNNTTALTLDSSQNATFAGSIAINNTVQTAVSVASTHKVTISIGGSTYYLLATNV